MSKKILVIKYGSGSVSGADGIDLLRLNQYANKINNLFTDYSIVIVSSGAVAAGRALLNIHNETDLTTLQAMIGTAPLTHAWQSAFKSYDIIVGQVLVTHHEIQDSEEGGRLKYIIHASLNAGLIPVINENDVLSDTELAKLSYGGDNDGLAAKIAMILGADTLLLLTNIDGLLDNDGKLVRQIEMNKVTDYLVMTDGASANGRGGMESKIKAAYSAATVGITVVIGNANADYGQLIRREFGTVLI